MMGKNKIFKNIISDDNLYSSNWCKFTSFIFLNLNFSLRKTCNQLLETKKG